MSARTQRSCSAGAGNGIPMNHVNGAARAPLQHVVRRSLVEAKPFRSVSYSHLFVAPPLLVSFLASSVADFRFSCFRAINVYHLSLVKYNCMFFRSRIAEVLLSGCL